MNDAAPIGEPPLTRMEKIQVLILEYNALRNQLLQRNTVLNQVFTVSGTVATTAIVVTFTQSLAFGVVLLFLLPIAIWAAFRLV